MTSLPSAPPASLSWLAKQLLNDLASEDFASDDFAGDDVGSDFTAFAAPNAHELLRAGLSHPPRRKCAGVAVNCFAGRPSDA